MCIWTASDFIRTGFSISDAIQPVNQLLPLTTGKAAAPQRRYTVTFLRTPFTAETIGCASANSTYYRHAVWVGGSGEDTKRSDTAILREAMGIADTVSLRPEPRLGMNSRSRVVHMHQERIVGAGSGSVTVGRDHALLWDAPSANAATDLHPHLLLGANSASCALAVNATAIVGFGQGSRTGCRDHALLWTGSTAASAFDIHPDSILGEQGRSYARGVSDGCIVGYGRGQRTQEYNHALLWKEPAAAVAVDLHPSHLLGADSCSFAHAVAGQRIVGFGRGVGTHHADHALLWTGSRPADVIDLHQFAPPGSQSSRAYGVDARGNIVGWIDGQAALWQIV